MRALDGRRLGIDQHGPRLQGNFLAPERLDDDEAQARQGDDDDEEDGQRAAMPAGRPISCRASLGQALAAAPDRERQHEHVLHGAGEADADDQPEQPRQVAELDRQHRADQRPGAGDGGEVVAEQDPLVGRVVVLAVVELVCGRVSRASSSTATRAARNACSSDRRWPGSPAPRASPAWHAKSSSTGSSRLYFAWFCSPCLEGLVHGLSMVALQLDEAILDGAPGAARRLEPRGQGRQVVTLGSSSATTVTIFPWAASPRGAAPSGSRAEAAGAATGGGQAHSDSGLPHRSQVGGRSQGVPAKRRVTVAPYRAGSSAGSLDGPGVRSL